MLGFDWATNGSATRAILMAFVYTAMICIPLFLVLQFGLFEPMNEHWKQLEANNKLKTQQEHDKLVSMDCKSLGDWLLQDNVWSHDNLIWAQNHYLVSCK